MAARIIITVVLVILAAGAFWGDALGVGYRINPFGVLCLLLAVLNWFAWDTMREGWSQGRSMKKGGVNLPLDARFGPVWIKGIFDTLGATPPRRTSSDKSSNQEQL
jgi:hypothetical protein